VAQDGNGVSKIPIPTLHHPQIISTSTLLRTFHNFLLLSQIFFVSEYSDNLTDNAAVCRLAEEHEPDII